MNPNLSLVAGNRGKGRKKGVPNRVAMSAKLVLEYAAEGLGGAERLMAWVNASPDNERLFWTIIYPKLLPLKLTGDAANPLAIDVIERVIVQPPDYRETVLAKI